MWLHVGVKVKDLLIKELQKYYLQYNMKVNYNILFLNR